MTGFFSVRLAPGLRVSASPRGLRTHVGPRGARVHVGGGGTGVSTGAGPVTLYRSLGGSGAGPARYRTGPGVPEDAPGSKEQRVRRVQETLTRIANLHRQRFPAARPPTAPEPEVPDPAELVAQAEREELDGIAWFRFGRRREARQRARASAGDQEQVLRARAVAERRRTQEGLDRRWDALVSGDPEVVLEALSAAFEDNQAPAAAVGCEGTDASLVVLVPSLDAVPDHQPGTTAAGNLSLRQASQTWRNRWYRELVCGHLLVSTREAFAVAPSLQAVSVVALRDQGPDVYGAPRARPVLATRLTRARLDGVRWEDVSAWEVVDQAGAETVVDLNGRAHEMRPLDLGSEPDLARIADAVDLDELDASGGLDA